MSSALIKALLKQGKKGAAEKDFGKRAVAQVIRRDKAKAEKEMAKRVADKAGAMPSIKKEKMSKQQKATAAFKRAEAKAKKLKDTPPKKPVQVQKVKSKEAQAMLDDEMRRELRGETVKARRERLKKATDKKKQRKARKLTEGRESSEEFEARMSREARQGGGQDVGRRKANRGSASDPLYEYEAGQASSFLRGKDKPFLDEYEKDLVDIVSRKKGGKVSPRGCGKALRGYGKAMKGGK